MVRSPNLPHSGAKCRRPAKSLSPSELCCPRRYISVMYFVSASSTEGSDVRPILCESAHLTNFSNASL